MIVLFQSKQLERWYEKSREAIRKLGAVRGKLFIRRINEMQSALNLADLFKLPGARCHPLTTDRAGCFAVDLQQPYRLVFEPVVDDSEEERADELDLTKVTSVRLLEVVDYHD